MDAGDPSRPGASVGPPLRLPALQRPASMSPQDWALKTGLGALPRARTTSPQRNQKGVRESSQRHKEKMMSSFDVRGELEPVHTGGEQSFPSAPGGDDISVDVRSTSASSEVCSRLAAADSGEQSAAHSEGRAREASALRANSNSPTRWESQRAIVRGSVGRLRAVAGRSHSTSPPRDARPEPQARRMPKLSSSFEPEEERRAKSRFGFSSSSSCLTRSRSTVDQRLVLGGSHRKTALAQVREAGQILRHQIRLAFWSAAKTRAEVHSKLEQRAQGRGASAVASYHRGGAAAPRDGWVLDKRQLAQLLHNLQIHLCDPVHDAVVIMDALDVDGTVRRHVGLD